MNSPRTFSRIGSQLDVNGERYQTLQFVDICAAYGERLRAWREQAIAGGMAEKDIRASIAIDTKPRDEDVHEMDVVDFFAELPAKSVRTINGDWINVVNPNKKRGTEAGGLGYIADDIQRVLQKKGELLLTMPLREHRSVMKIVRETRLDIEPIAFGYVGFLGGKNNLGFPANGLPAVAPDSHHIRLKQALVKTLEEEPGYAYMMSFADQIGTHIYSPENPVRYRAVKKKN